MDIVTVREHADSAGSRDEQSLGAVCCLRSRGVPRPAHFSRYARFVSDVLDDVVRGMAWEAIIERWHGSISKEAIAEAVRLAREALINHADELVADTAR